MGHRQYEGKEDDGKNDWGQKSLEEHSKDNQESSFVVICDERVCASNICFNGGTCMVDDVSRRFSCKCSPGFSGSLCQETCALECANGVCVKGALGKEQCQCTQGWSGALCEVSGSSLEGCTRTEDCGIGERCIENDRGFKICIRDPCESRPCRNNASCAADGVGFSSDAFLCTCQSGFAGKLCETDVNECELTPCQHGGTCINTEGSFECLCEPQFTGPQCEQEVVTCATSPCLNQGTCVDTQIGYYCICPFGYEGKKCDKEVSEWDSSVVEVTTVYSMTEVPTTPATNLKVATPSRQPGGVQAKDVLVSVVNEAGYQLLSRSLPRTASFDVFSTRVGKIGESEYFLGCIADFSINEANAIDLSTSGRGTNIASGCKHTVQCSGNPCLNGGSCQDFWTHFTCACKPPFLPPLCMNSLPPSTFGHENETSFVEISVPSETSQNLKFLTTIQFIMRSSSPNGTILFLGEVGDELATFISISIQEGHILVRSRAGGRTVHELKSRKRVDDNKDHVLSIRRQRRQVKLEVDGTLDSEGTMPSRFDHPLFAEILQLASGRNVTSDAFATSASFKGTLQDTRINEKSVVLHSQPFFAVDQLGHVTTQENVLEGMISDDVCAETEQCVHGECRNTFNDFECNCQKGFFGKRCERKDHCSNFPCPTEGDCENVGDGYICAVRTPILRTIADGQWHTIEISEKIVYVDSTSYGLPEMIQLPSRLHSPTVIFGGTDDSPSFDGCLRDVQIGELPRLSFYRPEEIGLPRNVTYWIPERREKMATGCLSSPQCDEASPCVRGECRDLWNSFTCECPNGFEGQFCELNRNECSQIECDHGQCVDGIGVARCQCDSGYTGEACDVEMDHCSLIPCKNSGLCINSNGSFICECRNGWAGRTCEFRTGGTGVKCQCRTGFIGPFCEERIDPCSTRPCTNGYCSSSANGFKCDCEEGYSGETCSVLSDFCTESSCNGHGHCAPIWNATMCSCDKNWRGASCLGLVDYCLSIPCENDGTCETVEGGFKCHCRKYYMGDRCQLQGTCLRSPCEKGECMQLTYDTHSCSCPQGYEGSRCEVRINYCKTNSCLNGGSCESLLGGYKCHCVNGFTGTNCETDIDECMQGFCANGAKCRDRVADYECDCDGTGFMGKNCTIDINECVVSNNCVHGRCTNTRGGFRCDCEKGFIGSRCVFRDPCQPDAYNQTTHTCVHGTCINPSVKADSSGRETAIHECKCNRGYTGSQCTTKAFERKMLGMTYVLGPVAAILTVLTILGCVLLAFVLRGKRSLHGHYSPSHQERNGTRMQHDSVPWREPAKQAVSPRIVSPLDVPPPPR
ncbi:hypothetical protein Q1695_000808 [Nippostrongylus brasiliensis]|nr:hypothetical protein Q1695_000808 [Nippostrongylus brasiliensis]